MRQKQVRCQQDSYGLMPVERRSNASNGTGLGPMTAEGLMLAGPMPAGPMPAILIWTERRGS